MKILVIIHYQNPKSPCAIYVRQQVKAIREAGHQVRLLVPLPIGKVDYNRHRFSRLLEMNVIEGADFYFLRYPGLSKYGGPRFNSSSAALSLRLVWNRLFQDFTPDVIHAHTLGFDSNLGAWLRTRLGCPLVVTTHGSDTTIPVREGRGQALKRFADKADTVVCVSSRLKRALEAENVTAPLCVIWNGFELPSEETVKGKKALLSFNQTGNLIAQKKVDVTIRALAALRQTRPEALLTVVGEGEERPALEKLCETLGVSECVRFLGRLDNREVQREMSKAQFFVMPSVREGFGIVYLEAMAAGCITVGTEGEGIADLIRSGENGFLVPPDDSDAIVKVVERCLQNPKKAQEIAECGRREALRMTWERNAEQYIHLFASLSDRRTPA